MARRRGATLVAAALALIGSALASAPSGASEPVATPHAFPPGCHRTLPLEMASTAGATQLVTVVAPSGTSTLASVTAWRRSGRCWIDVMGPWIGRVGISGIRAHKREGDGATPLGIFDFYSTVYGNSPNPGVHLRYRRLRCGDWWDEDATSAVYNTFEQVRCDVTPSFANGESEPLWLSPVSYASFAVIGYNSTRVPGRGSAIFLHVSVGEPTAGCVAIARPLLDRVLDWLRLSHHPRIAIATRSTIASL